jgi:hypothetical protein
MLKNSSTMRILFSASVRETQKPVELYTLTPQQPKGCLEETIFNTDMLLRLQIKIRNCDMNLTQSVMTM